MSTTTQKYDWAGLAGRSYTYWIYPIGTDLKAAPGNYCFAREITPGVRKAVYFGQTGDLSERFDFHHKMGCAKRSGATHTHAHINNGGERARLSEEADLVARHSPPCNG